MTIQDAISIVNAHHQKYSDSCSPSLCEMLLKLSGAVPLDYYDEQERDKNNPVGLSNIENKTIHERTFRRFDKQTSLFDKIKIELGKNKYLGIYLPIGGNFHGFVIADMNAQNVILFSKLSELGQGQGRITLPALFPQTQVHILQGYDCIYYEDV